MKERFRRRRLPHFDKPGAIYFVTSCLEGSIPAIGLADIEGYRQTLNKHTRVPEWKLLFARSDQWLDRAVGVNHLADDKLAKVVEGAILYFARKRYAIWAWVVMGNHIHWVFEPSVDWVASIREP